MRPIDADELRQVLEVFTEKDTLGHTPLQLCDAMPTASPWHRVEEKPAKEEECLTVSVDGHIEVNWWSNSWGWLHDADNIEWWMPIEPPKEDA